MARLLLCLAASGLLTPALRGQDRDPELLRLQGVVPGGTRTTVTESPTAFQFTVLNFDTTPRDARVVVYYPEQEDVQYARDVWVPPLSALTTWLPVGPAPKQAGEVGREIRMLLFDRTNGGNRLVLPAGSERVRSRAVLYRKREQTVAVVLNLDDKIDADADERVTFSHTVRNSIDLSDRLSFVNDGTLPPTAET